MELLIPATYNWIKNKGRVEGKKAHLQRLDEACRRFGFEVDGVWMLPRTPEVDEFLRGKAPARK